MEAVHSRSLEKGNSRLQEQIHEELAQGEAWQRQYEALLESQAQLCALLQAKSLQALEKKSQARQKELDDLQEALQECWSQRCQSQLHVHKQEKENRRLVKSVTELEHKVFKEQQKENSGKALLREMRTEGGKLKRHLSMWEAECQAENEMIREKQDQLEKQCAILQELSLRSQELHRKKTPLEDRVIEAQLEADLFQEKASLGPARTPFLWKEQAPGSLKRFPYPEPEGTNSKEQPPSRSFLCPVLWTAWCWLWASSKALLLLLLLMLALHVLYGFFSGGPCSRLASTPLLYIRPQGLLPPSYT